MYSNLTKETPLPPKNRRKAYIQIQAVSLSYDIIAFWCSTQLTQLLFFCRNNAGQEALLAGPKQLWQWECVTQYKAQVNRCLILESTGKIFEE